MKTNMREITQDELDEIIRLHNLWLEEEEEGIKADLSFVDLSEIDLTGINLLGANFENINLSHANLRNANLRNANLRNANLEEVDLREADLSYADLTYAVLKRVDLENTNLSNAILTGVNLEGTNLYKTNLFYAKVEDMIGVSNLGKYNRTAYYFFKEDRVICGCFDDTLDEFERQVKEKYSKDSNYYVAIKVFKSFRK